MPNHVMMTYTITGDSETLETIVNKHFNGEQFSFNTFAPIPQELANTIAPSRPPRNATEDELKEWENYQKRLMETHGATNWYDWCIQNWGTKWDSYEFSMDHSENAIQGSMWTAWSLPDPIFEKFAKLYPNVTMVITALEEGGAFAGFITIEDGEVIYDLIEDDYDAWRDFAEEHFGYEFYDEDE